MAGSKRQHSEDKKRSRDNCGHGVVRGDDDYVFEGGPTECVSATATGRDNRGARPNSFFPSRSRYTIRLSACLLFTCRRRAVLLPPVGRLYDQHHHGKRTVGYRRVDDGMCAADSTSNYEPHRNKVFVEIVKTFTADKVGSMNLYYEYVTNAE